MLNTARAVQVVTTSLPCTCGKLYRGRLLPHAAHVGLTATRLMGTQGTSSSIYNICTTIRGRGINRPSTIINIIRSHHRPLPRRRLLRGWPRLRIREAITMASFSGCGDEIIRTQRRFAQGLREECQVRTGPLTVLG